MPWCHTRVLRSSLTQTKSDRSGVVFSAREVSEKVSAAALAGCADNGCAVHYGYGGDDGCRDAKEELRDLHTVFRQEMALFRECGGQLFVNGESSLPPSLALSDVFAGSVEDVNAVIDRCMTVSSGISSQYLYRSMYAAQIHHCLKVRGCVSVVDIIKSALPVIPLGALFDTSVHTKRAGLVPA